MKVKNQKISTKPPHMVFYEKICRGDLVKHDSKKK